MPALNDPFLLEGKTIIITGASSGLGKATAYAAAERKSNLILVGRNESSLEEIKSSLPSHGRHIIIKADLSLPSAIDQIVSKIENLSILIDGLVYSAGISTTLPFIMTTTEKIQKFNLLNVASGVELAGKISNRLIVNSDGASFIFIASVMGLTGEVGKTIYSLTKGAIIAGTRSMALELAPKRIRVNSISPGIVETPMVSNAFYSQDPESIEKIKALHPLGFGKPEDVANACIFLLSNASKWITGTNLVVDGGYTAK